MLFDLGIFSKTESHVVSFKEAGTWSLIWVALSVAFYFFLRHYGHLVHGIDDMATLQSIQTKYAQDLKLTGQNFEENIELFRKNMSLKYLTGYVVEYSLSADNIFVFILIFSSFGVKEKYFKKILVWGILGAIILRFIFIFLGAALLQRFDWIMYIFGAFLVYTGVKIFFTKEEEEKMDTSSHPIVKFVDKYFNVYKRNVTDHFMIFHKGLKKWYITPIGIVVFVIAGTDLVFAVDSIPAIFSITKDPYIVFFSNVFAIMGLRSMFFFLSSIMGLFRYLPLGLGVLLSYIGLKMIFHHQLTALGFSDLWSLAIIVLILGVSIGASLLIPEKKEVVV
jgi:tellurite resistance protein TerC